MKTSLSIFWVDAVLFALLVLALLMVLPEIASHTFVHVLPGLLLMTGAGLHLWLHWDWIKTAFSLFGKMPKPTRVNALLDLALFVAYLVCGGLGLSARLILFVSPLHHIFFGILHALTAVLLLSLQTIHLARHFKWIKTSVRRHALGALSGNR
jgi:tellurite resistance protein TehA-like permease